MDTIVIAELPKKTPKSGVTARILWQSIDGTAILEINNHEIITEERLWDIQRISTWEKCVDISMLRAGAGDYYTICIMCLDEENAFDLKKFIQHYVHERRTKANKEDWVSHCAAAQTRQS
jgi:hypothetical protein